MEGKWMVKLPRNFHWKLVDFGLVKEERTLENPAFKEALLAVHEANGAPQEAVAHFIKQGYGITLLMDW